MTTPWWRSVLAVLLATLAKVFWEPIRDGSPRFAEWPRGLRLVVGLAGAGYVLAGVLILLSGWIRSHDQLVSHDGNAYPSWGLTFLFWLVVLTLALALTAALHIHPALGALVILLLGGTLLAMLPALDGAVALLPPLAVLGLVVFWLARVRYRFAWFEFPVVLTLVGLAAYAPVALSRFGVGADLRPMLLLLLLGTIVVLSAPALVMAGYAPAEIAVSLAEWLLDRVHRQTSGSPRRWAVLLILLAAGLGVFGWDVVNGVRREEWDWRPEAWLASLIVVGAVFATCWLLLARRPGTPPSGPTPERWNGPAYVLAVVWVLIIVPVLVLALVGAFFSVAGVHGISQLASTLATSDVFTAVGRLVAIGLAVWWLVRARRGEDRVRIVLLVSFIAVALARTVPLLTDGTVRISWTLPAVTAVAVAITLVLAVVALVRRRGVERQLWIALLALLISAAVGRRDLLSEPGSLVAGVSGLAVLLLGLVWRVLTDAGITRQGTRWFPVPARVLFYAAHALLAAVVLAHVGLNRQNHSAINPELQASIGLDIIATPMILAAIVLGAMSTIGLDGPRSGAAPDTLKPHSPDEKTVIREPQHP